MIANIVILLLITVFVLAGFSAVKAMFSSATVSSTRTRKPVAKKPTKRQTAYHG